MPQSTLDLSLYPKLRRNQYLTPFRYPGGKTFLGGFLSSVAGKLKQNAARHYVEPYCGGAGAGLYLLANDAVDHVHLNDMDPCIYSSWHAILYETERFLKELDRRPVTLETWHECRNTLQTYNGGYSFDAGFATFFINRTSRSGIILGSGPIGGYGQNGKWKMDARYYRQAVRKRIEWISQHARRISISNYDGLEALVRASDDLPRHSTMYLVDPPYVTVGGKLYLNAMKEEQHQALANFLTSGQCANWTITYDDHPLVRSLYKSRHLRFLNVYYSMRNRRRANELLIQ
ncbi:DNA adenine methylase [Thioalkalivibrio sp. ALE20]|uniref:DNA adenine methylase n=1 Tax=Thioalkalivibrio sp. ALE20 TaxID=545275 RepID=UPI000A025779|nr:DNA adenine methylase [Thioalkalivibrio sp. ALE20]